MHLLVVEDDPSSRELLAELFRLRGWVVTDVATTQDAIDALRLRAYDVIISDEDLYGESGSRMLRAASAEGLLTTASVLMYTAENRELDVPAGVAVLRKPIAGRELVARVETETRPR